MAIRRVSLRILGKFRRCIFVVVGNVDNSRVSVFDLLTVHMQDVAESCLTYKLFALAFVVLGLLVHLRA
jgi:hypothetical protein